MAHDIFVSYSQHDREAAERMCTILEHSGFTCWIAPRDILPSMTWAASIVQAIKQCHVMVLVFSGNANRSDQIPREVTLAEEQRVRVIPVRIENARPTGDLEYYLPSTQWLDLFPKPLEAYTAEIVRVVTALLAHQKTAAGQNASTEVPGSNPPGPNPDPASHGPDLKTPWNLRESKTTWTRAKAETRATAEQTSQVFGPIEKVYLAMCYFFPFFFAGALVLVVDRKKSARLHAWQTVLIAAIADTIIYASSSSFLTGVLWLASCVLCVRFWLGKKVELPFVGPLAEKLSGWRFPD